MMVRSIVIPILAAAGVALAAYTAISSNQPIVPAQPVAQPAVSPFTSQVAGAGIVEASSQNVSIGTNVPGVVTQVHVNVGDRVEAGAALFTIDERSTRSELAVAQAQLAQARAALAQARAALARDQASPRPEDLPPAQARVEEVKSQLADATAQLDNAERVKAVPGTISQEELDRRRWAVETARARVTTAEAELARIKAGTWGMQVDVSRAEVAAGEAQVVAGEARVAQVMTELERLTVRAPSAGQVLQVNVRAGEFAQAGVLSTPLMLFGSTSTLHVRVDVDENDAWRVRPQAKARASLRGNASLMTELTFVRIEPYVIPKRSLTGDSSERVDTRVLQVLYSFPSGTLPVYVGQQMDVFIEAPSTEGARASR
jgi:multidrug resistance efflux pump